MLYFLRYASLIAALLAIVSGPAGVSAQTTTLSIEDAVDIALEANFKLLNLVDQNEVSELDYESARSAYKTKFGSSASSDARSGAEVGSTYSLYLSKKNESGSGYSAGFYTSSFGDAAISEWRVSYTLPFFRNPLDSNRLAVSQSEVNAARAERMVEIGREELVGRVVSSYFLLAMAIQNEELSGKKLAIAQNFHAAQQVRHGNGEISELELAESELAIIDSRQQRDMSTLERFNQEDSFRLLLGLRPDAPFNIDETVLDTQYRVLSDETLPELESYALQNRVELLAKSEELDLISEKIQATRIGRLPPMEISLQYALVGEGEDIDDTFDFDDQRVGVGFSMNTDLVNSEVKIKRRKLFLMRQTNEREYEHLQRTVAMEVRSAYAEVRRFGSSLKYAKQYLKLASKQHDEAEIRHKRGDITELELLESSYRFMEARMRALAARVDYLLAEQSLAMASGKRIVDGL